MTRAETRGQCPITSWRGPLTLTLSPRGEGICAYVSRSVQLCLALRRLFLDLPGRLDEGAHGSDGFVEHRLLLGVERDLDDALDALGADHHGNADIEVLD